MQEITRLIAPTLAAIFLWLSNIEFGHVPPGADAWKICGILLPALWLTGVGPHGLIKNGGLIMSLLKIKPTRQRITLFGLLWLILFLVSAYLLSSDIQLNIFFARLLYGMQFVGVMATLGVFAFLSVTPDDVQPQAEPKDPANKT